jgi:hypothetical protein
MIVMVKNSGMDSLTDKPMTIDGAQATLTMTSWIPKENIEALSNR